jgi:hypothetical protein
MNFTLPSLVSILLLATAATQPAARASQAPPPVFQATVSPAKAQFTLPIPHRDTWEWRRSDTPDNRQEYAMDVTVNNNKQDYKFGFYLFKKPGSSPMRGDLAALLKAGQQSLFLSQPDGRYSLVKDAKITVRAEKDSVVISIEGKENIERLFSSRPEKVRFTLEIPEERKVSSSAPVAYTGL